MPATHLVSVPNDQDIYHVTKNGVDYPAHVLHRNDKEVYVHYVNTDKRMDEWVPEEACHKASTEATMGVSPGSRKRKRGRISEVAQTPNASMAPSSTVTPSRAGSIASELNGAREEIVMTEEDFDIQHHKQITAQRNFDNVYFGEWKVKTWYFSPYPLTDAEVEDVPVAHGSSSTSHAVKIPGVHKTTARSHGRTSDLLAGGLGRTHVGEKSTLWVCQLCFKYMADGNSYELHVRTCKMYSPPGELVYERGAHKIWEVDGAKNKLYCQNLSLFGKLFIDVKTLFFDCDNFLFYLLTDADNSSDVMIGFFSKEKISYDDYNLACIMILPPYQRKGYGMLLIEFSYELSRRAGKVGTPERPLSDLGLRSYLAYWVSSLIRFFRRVLTVLPADVVKISSFGWFPDPIKSPTPALGESAKKKKAKTKGWDGEHVDDKIIEAIPIPITDPMFTTHRIFETEHRQDGGANTHVSVRCTVADIARATSMRVEDAAFALNECGLLMERLGDVDEDGIIVISRALVEKIAKERKVKPPCMRPGFCKVPYQC